MTLGDVLQLQRGFDITKAQQRPGRVPVVSSSGVGSSHDTAKCSGPGVVIGRKGSLGTVFFVAEDYWPHDTTLWVRDFKNNDPKYCFFLLRTLRLEELDAGASNPTLNRNHAHLIRTRIPDVFTQTRIAEILSAFDRLIEANQRRVEILEETARSLYEEWFVRHCFPGNDSAKFVETTNGRAPADWRTCALGEVAESQYGYTDSGVLTGTVHLLRGMDLNKSPVINWSTVPYCGEPPEDGRYKLRQGDVLVVRMADPGRVGIVEHDVEAVFASYLVRVRAKDDSLPPYFLYYALRTESYQNFISGASTGATRRSISARVMLEPPIVIPPNDLVALFEERAHSLRGSAATLSAENSVLQGARDLLLPKLVTGAIEVDTLGIDDVFGWTKLLERTVSS